MPLDDMFFKKTLQLADDRRGLESKGPYQVAADARGQVWPKPFALAHRLDARREFFNPLEGGLSLLVELSRDVRPGELEQTLDVGVHVAHETAHGGVGPVRRVLRRASV